MTSILLPVSQNGSAPNVSVVRLLEEARRTGHLNLTNIGLETLPELVVEYFECLGAKIDSHDDEIEKGHNDSSHPENPAKCDGFEEDEDRPRDSDDSLERDCERDGDSDSPSDQELPCTEVNPREKSPIRVRLSSVERERQRNRSNLVRTPNSISFVISVLKGDADAVESDEEDKSCGERPPVPLTRLSLASNNIEKLGRQIGKLGTLQVLDVQDNQLKHLPSNLGYLQKLTRLVISHNQLVKIAKSVYSARQLRFLLAQDNKICRLSTEIGLLTQLEFLDLSQNDIQLLPPSIGCLARLTRLNLSKNKIQYLPEEIRNLSALSSLDLTHNYLEELPSTIGELRALEQLFLRHNKLSAFPMLCYCGKLKELYLGGNGITFIPKQCLLPLPGLNVLELRDNRLEALPEEIELLENVIRLDLSNNILGDLPNSLGYMTSLKTLTLEGNPLTMFNKVCKRESRGTEELLRNLRNRAERVTTMKEPSSPTYTVKNIIPGNAELSNNCLSHEEAHMLQFAHILNYSNKQMTEVPDEIFSTAIQAGANTLRLTKNHLTEIPVKLKDVLHRLVELDVSFNELEELPSFLGYAPHLRILDVHDNQLISLPSEFSHLRQLQKLNIGNNRFHEIPEVIYELSSLEMLFAPFNRIEKLDIDGLRKLKQLYVLDLSNNDIKRLPYELGYLSQLRRLVLSGNSFRQPRPAVLAKGTPSLLEWLRDRIPDA